MKSDQERVFVVVDPTASEHIALQRAIITARFAPRRRHSMCL